ncbi:MAG: D-aminoacyl-tRNA deacylase [Halodesulfurarchaeum sp.]
MTDTDAIGIVVSRPDQASVHIGERLLEIADWDEVDAGHYRREGFEIREFDEWHLELDDPASQFGDISFLVVASRHSGETGPLLSAHFTGNFGKAEYGGASRELARACPGALRDVIGALDENAPVKYDIAMECTHHGPTDYGAPAMYVELGSGPDEWNDTAGADAVASSILALEGVSPTADRTLVAFGGNHYAPRATRILRETEFAVGHVAADWSLDALGDPAEHRDVLVQVFERSGANCAIFEGDYPVVEEVVRDLGYRVVSETWVRQTSGLDPGLVEDLEVALSPVEDGLRFGQGARGDGADSFLVVDVPKDLIEECQGIDRARTLSVFDQRAIAYETKENGNRVGDRAALAGRDAWDAIVEALVEILETAYETVRRDGDVIVAERTSFDPALAAEQNVPEGPKFGRLAEGEAVEVEGETVEPDEVKTREIHRFSV